MKTIRLNKGMCALVDDDDFEFLTGFKWQVKSTGRILYAQRKVSLGGKRFAYQKMHREILIRHNPGVKLDCVDHINHNGLDNRKANLRAASASENNMNRRKFKLCTSRHKGVWFESSTHKWRARVTRAGKSISKRFETEADAAVWYNSRVSELFGGFAILNEIV